MLSNEKCFHYPYSIICCCRLQSPNSIGVRYTVRGMCTLLHFNREGNSKSASESPYCGVLLKDIPEEGMEESDKEEKNAVKSEEK